ncbi:hypothetical protein [Telluribacter sp. SYSU D00476]|uniref:hypothetical protein n=1 Tax=Telluribacter sp. SYSU D00476 TaxID=2811430 RepID=UPI001FF15AF0|nr:hypothetical protein [Telluribacter sp. SYSU D00476]
MNKILLFVWMAALAGYPAFSQTPQERDVKVGVVVGKSLLGTYQSEAPWRGVGGGLVGVDLNYPLFKNAPRLSLHFQPHWEKAHYHNRSGELSNELIHQSINLPILLRFQLSSHSRFRPFVEVGAGYRVAIKHQYKGYTIICPFATPCRNLPYETDLVSASPRGSVALLAGVGAELPLGSVRIPITVRVNQSVSSYRLDNSGTSHSPFKEVQTSTLQVVTGVSF